MARLRVTIPILVAATLAAGPLAAQYFNYRKLSIFGGSNEVQKNIIAKTMMGGGAR